MKKKSDKEKDLEALKKDFEKAQNIFVTGFEKLTVQQDFELRKAVRGAGGNYKVIKNNLAEKASRGHAGRRAHGAPGGHDVAGLHQQGSGGAGQGADSLRQGESGIHLQGGHGGRPGRSTSKSIQELAALPSREEILAKVLFLIQASAQRLVTALGGVGRNLAVVVDQGVKENKFSQ